MNTEQITQCAIPCVPRAMMGKSWYKGLGYNFPCACAEKAREDEEERKKPKPRGVIENCCHNCDMTTSNKVIMNKGKKNEREDYMCKECITDSIVYNG